MKIEKISENQIRCTLTQADLAERKLQLSELAYGTEKAKSLFHDMMQQAAFEFGFEADNMPLMIEAIPTSADSIVLIITKVEDPEEIDARFSKFAPAPSGDTDAQNNETPSKLDGADTLRNLFEKVKEKIHSLDTPKEAAKEPAKEVPKPAETFPFRLFSFVTMDDVMLAAQFLANMYSGSNTLYKDHEEDMYILAMDRADYSEKDFNRICNMLTEYGSLERSSTLTLAFLEEHCEALIVNDAVQQLALL